MRLPVYNLSVLQPTHRKKMIANEPMSIFRMLLIGIF